MLKEQKKNAIKSELKEIKLSCEISDHDLEIKAKKNKQKYNEESNRINSLSNTAIISEFTNAFE
jgi:translation initiation factor IF-3